MLVRLGRCSSQPSTPDVVDALLECHERIRRFSRLAVRMAESPGEPPEVIVDAASRLHRYFTVGLPRHVADEDLSILPRLRGAAAPSVDEALSIMNREHEEIDRIVAELVPLWERIGAQPALLPGLAGDLDVACSDLVERFDRHLESEERHIIPELRLRLPPAELEAIHREMMSRRRAE